MAYYVRTVHAGAVSTDPRSYVYAIYHCDDCGENTDVRIPDERTFQYINRACGSCGSVNAGDRTKALTIERNRLQDEVATRLNRIAEIDSILCPVITLTPTEAPSCAPQSS